MKVLITYNSYSGNTEEVAEILQQDIEGRGIKVDMHQMEIDMPIYDVDEYDIVLLGTFTWDRGNTPDEVKDFILDLGYKPETVAVFGTGDTQFGGDALYCNAVSKLEKFFSSRWEGLKVEQSPRGTQESLVKSWVEIVMNDLEKEYKEVI